MCWYCCISLRGAVYFGTSVHIFVGLVLLVRWIVLTYIAGFVTEKLISDASVLILTVLSGIYILLFLVMGCVIFAGTERESVSVLKWSAAGFTMLQILVFTVILILHLVAPDGWAFLDPESLSYEMRILSIAMYFCSLVATLNYLIVLFLYIRKLWNLKRRRSSTSASSVSRARISLPIQQQSNPSYAVSYHRNHNHRTPTGPVSPPGPESPGGIYESLDTHSVVDSGYSSRQPHPFFPANFYTTYQRGNNESLYNGSLGHGSVRSTGGTYYSSRPYPYPHQRYREPLVASTREEEELDQYGQPMQIFQRGQARGSVASAQGQPLIRQASSGY